MKKVYLYAFLTALLSITLHLNLTADTLPLGGRTASMGGAMAAFGHDSACPYLNPAGLVLVPGNILSLSTSVYTRNSYVIDNFYIPGKVQTGTVFGNTYTYDQESLVSANVVGFPGALCYKLNLNENNVIGFSVIVPEYDRKTFDGNLKLTFPDAVTGPVDFNISDSYIMERAEYYIGPTYALRLGRLRIGASLYLLYRTVLNSVESTSLNTAYNMVPEPTYPASRTTGYGKGTTYGFAPIVGAQLEIVDNLNAGVTLTSPVIHIAGKFEGSGRFNLSMPDDIPDSVTVTNEEGTIKYNKPFRARIGLGYEVKKKWAVALDAEYVLGNNKTTESTITDHTTIYDEGSTPLKEKTKYNYKGETAAAFNLYAGGEFYINENWVLRGGLFMMPTTNKLEKSQNDVLTLAIDRYGASLGVGNETDAGETTVGVTFVYGKGRTVAGDVFSELGASNYEYVDVTNYIIALSISGTVDFNKP